MNYKEINEQLESLTDGVSFLLSNLANASALLWEKLDKINWAGFYIMDNGKLKLGPFQGKIACTEIEVGKGVCGTAVKQNTSIVVPDVHKFPGHIACDSSSNSEIVIPIHKNKGVWGVLDIDSPYLNRFDSSDAQGLQEFVHIIETIL